MSKPIEDPKDFGLSDDVEWFLRDTQVAPVAPSTSAEEPSTPAPKDSIPASPSKSPTQHLTTSISNSNEHVTSKTKPAVATISEEQAVSPVQPESTDTPTAAMPPRRKANSFSQASSVGIFNRIKTRFSKPHSTEAAGTSALEASRPPRSPIFKENYRLSRSVSNDAYSNKALKRTMSTPITLESNKNGSGPSGDTFGPLAEEDFDPKLEQYVRFYSQKSMSRPNSRKLSMSELSCLLNHDNPSGNLQHGTSQPSGSKFSFLRRKLSVPAPALPPVSVATEFNRRSTSGTTKDATSYSAWCPDPPTSDTDTSISIDEPGMPEFKTLKPLKRVAFDPSTFLIDPPQQIPSRNPRKGNVEVLADGTLKIHSLTAEERKAVEKLQMGQGGGIVVGGTGALHYMKKDVPEDEGNLLQAKAEESDEKPLTSNPVVDKPMAQSKRTYSEPTEKMAFDLMYTRCCHLREILPIPAILKQIPKDSMAPLPILQLRNPNPTMVEVQTFADFIRIVPIIAVSLDGVNFSYEQFKILLSSMSANTQLVKLSLRNTPIDAEGWSLLCWFLSRNTSLSKLDITQCPQLTVNNFRSKKKRTKVDEIVRMTCNKENRSDMDWQLFTATLIARGGIEEFILTGCCITDIDVFEKLIRRAISLKTLRLGLAYNNVTAKHMEILLEYWFFQPFVRGLDLGFNDLSSSLLMRVILDWKKSHDAETLLQNSQIAFLSLNSTNMRFCKESRIIIEDFVLKLSNLKYLDLSNSLAFFSGHMENSENAVDWFAGKLPLFTKLIRLHLEHDNLSPEAITSIANVLPFCKTLGYFSLVGNELDMSAAAALIQAVKNGRKLCKVEADFDDLPSYFKDRIGLYCMRNMESMYVKTKGSESVHDGPEELTKQLNEILELKAKGTLDLNSDIVKDFIQKATEIQLELNDAVNSLNDLQLKKQLTLEGKETLVRLIFIDSSITKAIQLIDEKYQAENFQKSDVLADMDAERDAKKERFSPSGTALDENKLYPPQMTRTSSRTSLNHLDKEEGNVHRISSKIKFNFDLESSDFEDLSGEDIRKKISSINLEDLPDIISFVHHLKEKGVDIQALFTQIHNDEGTIDMNYITNKLQALKTQKGDDNTAHSDEDTTGHSGEHTSTDTPVSMVNSKVLDPKEGEEMHEIFDQMLQKYNSSGQ